MNGWHWQDKVFFWTVALVLVATVLLVLMVSSADAHFTKGCKKNPCKAHVVKPYKERLARMAHCESTTRWGYNGPSGFDGGLQFSPSTWRATGSRYAFAWQAPPMEQKYRAVVWASKIGWAWRSTAGWPHCG